VTDLGAIGNAVHVSEMGLAGAADDEVASAARAQDRAVVTENVVDFRLSRTWYWCVYSNGTRPWEGVRLMFWPPSSIVGRLTTLAPILVNTGRTSKASDSADWPVWGCPPSVSY